ncbi:TIGR04211 family SH3 domain-containing protein [Alteromonas sediminis]|uniref:TIGR04211 family SH3 domain-containing protein n=1 Tax=Alteromonas sediminis TaxID=2259342 RepID=UPI0014048A12|nr:TIGR04211 family SH3 domain-containing protein [Alteromonas sediminis]
MTTGFAQQNSEQAPNTATHFISEEVFIFMHAGPGRNYRILGSVAAGMPVTRTDSDETGDFVEVIDSQGRTGWIESEYLVTTPSFRETLPQLQEQLTEALASVAPLQQRISSLEQEVRAKDATTKQLQSELDSANERITALQSAQSDAEDALQMKWLLNGGGLAVGCIILGILLTYLPKRRKRSDNWMN